MEKIKVTLKQKTHIDKLLFALRSGEYKKTKGRLLSPDKCFCIQGVMCEVYRKSVKNKNVFWDEILGTFNIKNVGPGARRYFGSTCEAPLHVQKYFGLEAIASDLMWLNDTKNYSFNKLANYIESRIVVEDE